MNNNAPRQEHLNEALSEQIAYYRARASEYDQWFLRQGRYFRGEAHADQWFREVEDVVAELETFAPFGDVLEFAGGTGLWTVRLAPHSNVVTVVDASAEMVEINRSRLGEREVRYIEQDIFSFVPERQYDFIFFGFWLSHVPTARFDEFWSLVKSCLTPGGKFFFIDSIKEPNSTAVDHTLPLEEDSETLVRKLNDGREFRIFKLFYQPEELESRLEALGLKANVRTTESFFLCGNGSAD